MSTMTNDNATTAWIEEMVAELRLREVRGGAIGDAVAQVESYLADSGETAREAFGDPVEYARSLEFPAASVDHTTPTGWVRALAPTACGLLGFAATLPAISALRAGTAMDVHWGELAAACVVVLVAVAMVASWRAIARSRWAFTALFATGFIAAVVLSVALRSTAFTVSPWVGLGVGVVALAASVVWGRATPLEDEVIDPLKGADTAAGAGARAAREWFFVGATLVLGALTWIIG